jgi:uncharacterized membrane protein
VDLVLLLLRLLHILAGVFWAGTIFFVASLLLPAVREAGPEGNRVLLALQRRRFLDLMPVVAGVTIVTGFWLYIRSAGIPEWAGSRVGMALGLGGVLGVVAFAIGVGLMRPATLRAGSLAAGLPEMPDGPARVERAAEILRLRQRAAGAGRVVALLLGVTTALMAVARYL